MRLAALFDTIGPYLLGLSSHEETVPSLFGAAADPQHAKRLRIYERFCRKHRQEALDHVFAHCRATVISASDIATWESLVEQYFRCHPMHHFELNHNGRLFPELVAEELAKQRFGLPPYLAELADFEWWEWQTYTAADSVQDQLAEQGPLRVSSSVELRPFQYDLISWLDSDQPGDLASSPEVHASVVLFWRDRDLDLRRTAASQLDMFILKAVLEAVPMQPALAEQLGVSHSALMRTALDLHRAGIVNGVMPATVTEDTKTHGGLHEHSIEVSEPVASAVACDAASCGGQKVRD